MKRLLLLLLIILLGLIAIVVGRALMLPAAAYNSAPVSLPDGLDGQRAAENLAAAIRLPTLSHQVGAPASLLAASNAAFAGMREWLAQRYPQVTANTEPLATGSPSILLRWPGKDSQLPAVLLMAHQDVVPVAPGTEELWTHLPFSGAIAEGFVWGRGAIDSKGSMVAILEAVETLIAQGFQPQRDVLLAFGHDEEIGGHQLLLLQADLAALVLGDEAHHQAVGERPGLAAYIADIADQDAALLKHLPRHTLLQVFASLDEARQHGEHGVVRLIVTAMGPQQQLGAPTHRHYDAGGDTRICHVSLMAPLCPLPHLGCHGGAALATEFVAAAKGRQLPGTTTEAKPLLVSRNHQLTQRAPLPRRRRRDAEE